MMKALKPPIEALVDSFVYEEYDGINDWSEAEYKEPIIINNVRIDDSVSYSANDGKTILYNAVIFCYADLTEPMPEFKEQSKISYDGINRVIVKVIPTKEPFMNKLYGYELEVI